LHAGPTTHANPHQERESETLVVAPLDAGATSMAQLAYQSLRDAILAMDVYRPDADLRLDEKTLADNLGVSRTPVRQALGRLEHEGLVEIVPRRGAFIIRKSKSEITEVIRAWAALESMAARLLCERATDEQIGSLRALFADFDDHPELHRRITLPATLKWEVRDKLDQANINERVLFPGLDGLSRWLARYYTPIEAAETIIETSPAARARDRATSKMPARASRQRSGGSRRAG